MEKKVCVLLFLVAFIGASTAFPAKEAQESEFEFVPLEKQGRAGPLPGVFDPILGGDFDYPQIYNPFGGLYSSIEAMMTRMRNQLNQILNRLPEKTDETNFPELHVPNFADIDLSKGNTTSVTKVIDGHKVVINETEYNQNGDNGNSYFKVRIVDVQPDNTPTEKPKDLPKNREVEAVETNEENEIGKKEGLDNIETFDEIDYEMKPESRKFDWNDANAVESFDDNGIETNEVQQPFRDLSDDIYVNQLMADAGAPENPDAEFIEDIDRNIKTKDFRRRLR